MNVVSLPSLERPMPPAALRWEGPLVCLAMWIVLLLLPISIGSVGLGWDALNHHVYLGWTAQQHRFDQDFLAAGYQSTQAPYLNWPVYRMALAGWSGHAAGVLLATLHASVLWPVWMLARACIPGSTVFDFTMRALATAMAFFSALVLSALGSTTNDVLGAAPLVWALALSIEPIARGSSLAPSTARRCVLLAGLAAGLSVALKLSNGPLAVMLPALWLFCARQWSSRLAAVMLGTAGMAGGFLLGYGYWGWLLWRFYGNPLYPFYDHWFAPLRGWVGWAG